MPMRSFAPLPRKIPTTPERSRIMSAIRSAGNRSTEQRLVQVMRRYKIKGWRRNYPLFGKPDFVFPRHKLIVFVDGCFWHGCPRCHKEPHTNSDYWREKIRQNALRDRRNSRKLRAAGWRVMRIWEHDLKREVVVANRMRRALRQPPLEPI